VIDTLNREIVRIVKRKDIADKFFENLGFESIGSTPQELVRYMQDEIAKWAKVIQRAGIRVPKKK
jgi:tripartite-type tricarboxylate transporter receptor subunit TctC